MNSLGDAFRLAIQRLAAANQFALASPWVHDLVHQLTEIES